MHGGDVGETLRMTNVTESEMRQRCGTRPELEVKVVHGALMMENGATA